MLQIVWTQDYSGISVVYGGQQIQMSAAGNTVPVNDQKEKKKKRKKIRATQAATVARIWVDIPPELKSSTTGESKNK